MIDDSLRLSILGMPRPQARPRFTRQGFAYKDKKQLEAEQEFLLQLHNLTKGLSLPFEKHRPLELSMLCFFPIPKSRQRNTYEGDPHIVKPDLDNLVKFVSDCFNKNVWADDAQVCHIDAWKVYTDGLPRTEIVVSDIS